MYGKINDGRQYINPSGPMTSEIINPFFSVPLKPNVIDGMSEFATANRATHPTEQVSIPSHTLVIDSRSRDCAKYPTASSYKLPLGDQYENITNIELQGSLIPRSEYNVHSGNNKIDFVIGDFLTQIVVKESGTGYTTTPTVTISPPVNAGVQATATAIIDPVKGVIMSIAINNAGSGYSMANPPIIDISYPTSSLPDVRSVAYAIVGNNYTATLRPGQYEIGGNPTPPSVALPQGLLLEIQNAMNAAVSGTYNTTSATPFAVRVANQYPILTAPAGSAEAADTNATLFNRVEIININSDYWELLFCSGKNETQSSYGVLGFPWVDQVNPSTVIAVSTGSGVLIPGGTAFKGQFDYNLLDDPTYCILGIAVEGTSVERIESNDSSVNRKFGLMLFDGTPSCAIKDLSGDIQTIGGNTYLQGNLQRGQFWTFPALLKPLKVPGIDTKKFQISPPISKMTAISITFTKYGQRDGGAPQLYDFGGREHTLIFNISANDNKSMRKW